MKLFFRYKNLRVVNYKSQYFTVIDFRSARKFFPIKSISLVPHPEKLKSHFHEAVTDKGRALPELYGLRENPLKREAKEQCFYGNKI